MKIGYHALTYLTYRIWHTNGRELLTISAMWKFTLKPDLMVLWWLQVISYSNEFGNQSAAAQRRAGRQIRDIMYKHEVPLDRDGEAFLTEELQRLITSGLIYRQRTPSLRAA